MFSPVQTDGQTSEDQTGQSAIRLSRKPSFSDSEGKHYWSCTLQLTLQGATLTHILYHSPAPWTGLSTAPTSKSLSFDLKNILLQIWNVETSDLSLMFSRNSSLKLTTNGHLHLRQSSLSHPFEKQSLEGVIRHGMAIAGLKGVSTNASLSKGWRVH